MSARRALGACVLILGDSFVSGIDKDCGVPTNSKSLVGPAAWDECMEARVVLIYNKENEGASWTKGREGDACVNAKTEFIDSSNNPFVTKRAECPLYWNCVGTGSTVKACRNGLYCDMESNTCEQCAGCEANADSASAEDGDMPPVCGNCKTRFFPAVDEYSVFRLLDSCDQYSAISCSTSDCPCNEVMGCSDNGDAACRPGPVVDADTLIKAPSSATRANDENTIFVARQEFTLEMGKSTEGYGIVRSPFTIFATDDFAITAMYASISLGDGYPRKISWEQTGEVTKSCSPKIEQVLSAHNNRSTIRAPCREPSSADPKICDYTAIDKLFDATDCGFSTLAGYRAKTEGREDTVLQGMLWPIDSSDADENERRARANVCTQTMCASKKESGQPMPLQIFVTWKGTDEGGRSMASGGLSYEAFRQFSAFEAFTNAQEKAKDMVARSRKCLATKDC